MKIGVVFQKLTAEAKIAEATKNSVVEAMCRLGLDFCELPFTQDFARELVKHKVDVVFNAMHGKYGEDGYIQTILNALQVPYTHSGVVASQIGMNKILTNIYAKHCNIPTIERFTILKEDIVGGNYTITKKSVIKPACGGSSVATFILNEGEKLSDVQRMEVKNYEDGDLFIVEEWFAGREVYVGVLNNEVVGACKVLPSEEFYSYHAKYHSKDTIYEVPAKISQSICDSIASDSMKLHNVIGAKCISRMDFIIGDDGFYKMLEINTHPGLMEASLMPKICKLKGIEYEDIIQILLNSAEFEKI